MGKIVAFGGNGAITSANMAAKTQIETSAKPIIPTTLSRIRAMLLSMRSTGDSRRGMERLCSATLQSPSGEPNTRVQISVAYISQHLRDDRDEHGNHGAGFDHVEILIERRLQQQRAKAFVGK